MADAFHAIDRRLPGFALVEFVVVDTAERVRAYDSDFTAGGRGFLLQVLADPRYRAAGADAADQTVDLAVGIFPDLWSGGQIMRLGVVHVVVLVGVEAAWCFAGDPLGDLDVALGMVMRQVGAGHDDLGTVGLEHIDLFLAHLVRHGAYAAITAHRRHHGEPETGIAGGALDERRARLQQPGLLGTSDDIDGDAVLDRAGRVDALELGVDRGHARVRQAVQPNQGCVTYEINDAIVVVHRQSSPRSLLQYTQETHLVPNGPCEAA